jgi:multimeric flavodoxin WrbA
VKALLGLIASPRKMGNSELIVKEIFRQLPDGWMLNLLRIPEFRLKPCQGCYQCLFKDGRCGQQDDFPIIFDAMVKADAYVIAAPTYLFGAHASLKGLLDRGLTFSGYVDRLWGKPAVGVILAGLDGMEGYAKLMVDSFIKFTLADHRGSQIIYAALPGEVLLSEKGRTAARNLAHSLVDGPSRVEADSRVPRCKLCGGDTFRFLENGNIRCMVCSSEGNYSWNNDALQISTVKGEHSIFLTQEDATNHFAFLRGMKDRFVAKRKDLKEATRDYHDIGQWIRPAKD